jgi:hypothetical protein
MVYRVGRAVAQVVIGRPCGHVRRTDVNADRYRAVFMLRYVTLCYVMLCYVTLCYVMLCYVMLCYVMLCYVKLCYFMLCYVMLR